MSDQTSTLTTPDGPMELYEATPDGDLLVVAARVGTTRLIDNRTVSQEP